MRTIPVILDICKDIRELCPDAWLVNFTNPSGIITETILKHGGVKAIGLCNVPLGMQVKCAKLFDVDPSRVYVEFAGLNHFVFGRKVYVDGVDRTQEVIDKMKDGKEISMKNIPNFSFPNHILDAVGMIPAGYLKYYYTREKMVEDCKRAANEEGTRGEVVKKVEEELFELYKDVNLKVKPKQLEQRGGAHYSEAAVNLIDSLYNDDGAVHFVNVRNNGTISDLPDDVAIECCCSVHKWGAQPFNLGHLELSMRGQVSLMKAYEELTVQAGVNGDYNSAIKALAINPLVNDGDKAKAVLDDMLIANKDYLPQFKEKIAELEAQR